ncbi:MULTISPECIES: hypothetical protein [unclassified Microcoleus]|uniref:hypothetical protein n=1 Tax=unclassified Microcoleus TaxID=2642155 RepID=UPI002FD41609
MEYSATVSANRDRLVGRIANKSHEPRLAAFEVSSGFPIDGGSYSQTSNTGDKLRRRSRLKPRLYKLAPDRARGFRAGG